MRTATAADLPAIAEIYNDAVLDTASRPSTSSRSRPSCSPTASRAPDPATTSSSPRTDGRVVGMAYAATYRPRPAYDGTRETSVYLAPERPRSRAGARPLRRAARAGSTPTASTSASPSSPQPNAASEALHAAARLRAGRHAARGGSQVRPLGRHHLVAAGAPVADGPAYPRLRPVGRSRDRGDTLPTWERPGPDRSRTTTRSTSSTSWPTCLPATAATGCSRRSTGCCSPPATSRRRRCARPSPVPLPWARR